MNKIKIKDFSLREKLNSFINLDDSDGKVEINETINLLLDEGEIDLSFLVILSIMSKLQREEYSQKLQVKNHLPLALIYKRAAAKVYIAVYEEEYNYSGDEDCAEAHAQKVYEEEKKRIIRMGLEILNKITKKVKQQKEDI